MEGDQNNGWDPYHPNIAQDYSPQHPHLYSHQNNISHAGHQPPGNPPTGHQFPGVQLPSIQQPSYGTQPPGNPPTGHQFPGVQLPSIQQPSYGTQPPGNPPNGHQFPGVQPPSFQQPTYSTQPSGVQPPGIQPPGVYSNQHPGVQQPAYNTQPSGVQPPGIQPPGVYINQHPGVQQPAWGWVPPGVQQLAYGNQPYYFGYGQGPQSVISQPPSSSGYDKDNDNSYDEPIRQARIRLDALNREINEAKVLETSSSLFDRHIPQGSRERQLLTYNDEINTFYKSALDVKGDK